MGRLCPRLNYLTFAAADVLYRRGEVVNFFFHLFAASMLDLTMIMCEYGEGEKETATDRYRQRQRQIAIQTD